MQNDQIIIRFPNSGSPSDGKILLGWQTFTFKKDFVDPTSSWAFTIPEFSATQNAYYGGPCINVFIPGATLIITIIPKGGTQEFTQVIGIIEKRSCKMSSSSGHMWTIEGRDYMAKVVEGHMDPSITFPSNVTLDQILIKCFASFNIGLTYNPNNAGSSNITTSDSINKQVITGKYFAPDDVVDLTKLQLKLIKPDYNESAWKFMDKILKTQGLMMWFSADLRELIVSAPNWTQPPLYNIVHSAESGLNTAIDVSAITDITGQPALLYCKGYFTGTESTTQGDIIMINELVAIGKNGQIIPQVQAVLNNNYKNIVPINDPNGINARYNLINYAKLAGSPQPIDPTPIFLKNKDAQTLDELKKYVYREMSHFQFRVNKLEYTVQGLSYNGVPWAVNTITFVQDDFLGISETYFIKGIHMSKTSNGGGITKLDLIKLYTLDLGQSLGGNNVTKKPSNTSPNPLSSGTWSIMSLLSNTNRG